MRVVCLIVMLVCLIRIGQAYVLSVRHEAKQKELKSRLEYADGERTDMDQGGGEEGQTATEGKQADDKAEPGSDCLTDSAKQEGESEETKAGRKPEDKKEQTYHSGIPGEEGGNPILKKYEPLYFENGDLAGWLTVEGTKIDYPVMQCDDDEYYLHHDFDGQDSKYGCLYVRERADLENGTNFVIYGHNMRDGSMFGELDLYLEEAFYREHSEISFHTLYEEYSYEILAVFRSRIYGEKEDVFKYYQFYEAETEEEFDHFYENIKELSLYDTGVTAEFGDKFLTLSTCAYHVKDGRLAVVAKRVKPL